MLGSVFGRTDFSRILSFGPPDVFADFVAGFFRLIFVGKSAQEDHPGKSPAKSSKLYTTKILRHISADWPGQKCGVFFDFLGYIRGLVCRLLRIRVVKTVFLENGAFVPYFQGKIIYTPPPIPPFLAQRHFSGEGGEGVYSEPPRGRNFIRPPPFYTLPTPRTVFSGVGGWGCINFGPVLLKAGGFDEKWRK